MITIMIMLMLMMTITTMTINAYTRHRNRLSRTYDKPICHEAARRTIRPDHRFPDTSTRFPGRTNFLRSPVRQSGDRFSHSKSIGSHIPTEGALGLSHSRSFRPVSFLEEAFQEAKLFFLQEPEPCSRGTCERSEGIGMRTETGELGFGSENGSVVSLSYQSSQVLGGSRCAHRLHSRDSEDRSPGPRVRRVSPWRSQGCARFLLNTVMIIKVLINIRRYGTCTTRGGKGRGRERAR